MSTDDFQGPRVPPHSIEAEQSVLGGLLLDNSAWDRAGDLLTDSDFYRWEHRHIYAAIGTLVNATRPADVITVFEQLQSLGKAEECGGLVYLNALAQSVPSAANLRRYAEIVRERAVQRAAIATLDKALFSMWSADSVEAALDQAANTIAGLQRRQLRHVPVDLGAVLVQRADHISALASGEAAPAWPTGLAWLDETVLVRPGTLMIVAARPSTGKTAFGLELARRWAETGLTTLFASLEMSCGQLADRYIAAQGRIDHHAVQTGRLGHDAWGRLSDAVGRGSRLPLHLDDESGIGIAQLRAKARAVPNVRLIILDYLQLMSGGSGAKGETRNAELERVSRGLKTLAKDLGCAVIALSQLNRAVEARADKRPMMSDLRESGAIEQDADVIAGLWRVRSFDSGKQVVGLNVMKNRAGRLGEVGFWFDGPTQRWTEDTELDLRPARASASSHGGFE